MIQDRAWQHSRRVLTNCLSIDWRLSGLSCKTTHFSLEGGAPWSLSVNGKSAYSGRKAGQAGTSCRWESAYSFTTVPWGEVWGFKDTWKVSLWWRLVAATGSCSD